MIKKLNHKSLFFLIIFCLPVNLGKHFIYNWAYVNGLLVDYLVPTIYLIDILIFVLLILWLLDLLRGTKLRVLGFNSIVLQLTIFYLFCTFLSISNSERVIPSIYLFARYVLYYLFMLYALENFDFKKDVWKFVSLFIISVSLVSLLGLLQWYKQGSVFNNYLFLGEQPYSSLNRNVVRENFLGTSVIPPYGLFRHPNVFGVFLNVSITLIFYLLLFHWKNIPSYRKSLVLLLLLQGLVMSLTFSKFSWFVCFLSLLFLTLKRFLKLPDFFTTVTITAISGVMITAALFLPSFSTVRYLSDNPSFYKRVDLIEASQHLTSDHLLFGIGLNNITVYIGKYLDSFEFLKFIQPVHNIYFLVLTETGLLSLVFFALLLVYDVYLFFVHKKFHVALLILLQLLILGSFDHYFLTIQQTQILFLLTIAISLKYNLHT